MRYKKKCPKLCKIKYKEQPINLKNMETVSLIINSQIDGKPIRYNLKVSSKIAEKYAQIRKEKPELSQPEALKEARETEQSFLDAKH